MRVIPTRVHGVLDYLVGIVLIAAPFILGFSDNRPATMVPVVLGISALIYSLLTNYELGVIKVIPMSGHLILDFFSGVFLAASPWLLGFADRIAWPHVVFGLLEIGAALMTVRTPTVGAGHSHHGGMGSGTLAH